jgi:hypothetical protein
MKTFRLASLALALALTTTTTACQSTRGRQVAYAAGGAALVGGGALAIGSAVQADSEDDVPFDEIGMALGAGLAVAGALALLVTAASEPDDAPPSVAPAPMANVDATLHALAASR